MGVLILGTKKSSVLLEWVFLRYVAAFRMGLHMAPPCHTLLLPLLTPVHAALGGPLPAPCRSSAPCFFFEETRGVAPY